MLYALFLLNEKKHELIINKGVQYLENIQSAEGYWNSFWYFGQYYGTYLCTRIIALIKPQSKCLARTFNFLVNSQRKDGGWGLVGKESDALSTSLALISLSYFKTSRKTKSNLIVENSFKYLLNINNEDNYSQSPIFVNLLNSKLRSKSLTSAYILKAAYLWDKRDKI